MSFLQKAFDEILGREFTPTKVTLSLILWKFEKAGVKLNERLERDLEKQIEENIDKPDLQIKLDESGISKLNPHLPEDFDLNIRITSRDYDSYLKRANKQITKTVPKIVFDSGDQLYKTLRKDREATLSTVALQ